MPVSKINKLFEVLNIKPFTQFLLCNLIYSGSTFMFNLLFPLIFEEDFFEEFIYIFQMIFFMVSMSGFGLTMGLLRNHMVNRSQSYLYYKSSAFVLIMILFVLGLFPHNLFSKIIHINYLERHEHLLFYLSLICTHLFLFNFTLMNAEKTYYLMLKNVLIITSLRLIGLFLLAKVVTPTVSNVLLVIFIIPFGFEFVFFTKKLKYTLKRSKITFNRHYLKFLSFCIQIFVSGAIFVLCDRIYLIHLGGKNTKLAALLSFAYGFIGIISVFNASFTNYFLGKINPDNLTEIKIFKENVRKYTFHFFLFTTVAIGIVGFFVYHTFSHVDTLIVLVVIITLYKTAIVSYFGFTNILSKTLEIQNIELFINIFRLALVYLVVQYSLALGFITTLILTSTIMILGEYVLSRFISVQISKIE